MRASKALPLACVCVLSVATATGCGAAANAQVMRAPPPGSTQRAPAPSPPAADPWERYNRKSYAFSQYVDRVAIRPGALFYKRVVPGRVRGGLHNAFQNLGEPLVAINDLLQFRFADFGRSAGRFVANSSVGIVGLIDVAADAGVPHHDNTFGTTLGRAGVKPGPYVYVPVLGPTTVRDGIGQGVDVALNPFTWINYGGRTAVGIGTGIAGGLDLRANVDDDLQRLKAMSTDDYATLRSFYLQNRQAQINGGKVDVEALPDFDDPGAAGSHAAPPAAGSVSPSGAAPQPALPNAPAGDAAALPHPAGSDAALTEPAAH